MPALATLVLLGLAQTDWKPYQLGGFGFLLPSPPVEQKVEGSVKGARFWLSMHNGGNAIVILVSPLEEKAKTEPDGTLAAALLGTVESVSGTLVSQSDALVAGWPALDYRWKNAEGIVGSARAAAIDGSLVQIGVTGPSAEVVEGAFTLAVGGLDLLKREKGPRIAAGPSFAPYRLGASPALVELPKGPSMETRAVTEAPGAATIHRFVSGYGNRVYIAAYVDIPEAERPPASEVSATLERINEDVVGSLGGKAEAPVETRLADGFALRTVAVLGEGKGVARVESTLRGGRLYTLIAIVPAVWREHPEPQRFFTSFRLEK